MAKPSWKKEEEEIAKALGLRRVKFSGGKWPDKEDGEDDFDYIAQVKGTYGKGISIKVDDINSISKRAIIQNKTPLFIVFFDKSNYELGRYWVALPLDSFKALKEGVDESG